MINPIIKLNEIQKDIFIEIYTGDLHFGNNSVDPSTEFSIMQEQFLIPISNINFDILFINGDIYDHKVMANSDTAMYVSMFIDACFNICKSKGASFVIIMGTDVHDANQLKLFYHYLTDPSVDMRIVEKAKFEYIKGKRVLCLPEEYNKGSEYYSNLLYKSGFYDSVAMHGTIVGGVYGANIMDLDGERAVFDLDNFCYCKGPIISGHIHTPMCLKGYMYYVGSPIRYEYGQEEPKGFSILLHNLKTREFYMHFNEIVSFKYDTINLDSMLNKDPKEVVEYIKNLQNSGIHNIRVEFTQNHPNVDILKNYYRTNNRIKIKDNREKSPLNINNASLIEDDYPKEFEDLKFLLDKSINEYEKFTKFVNYKKGYAYISSDELINILEGVE